MTAPAIDKLRAWLAGNDMSANQFAIDNGIDPSYLSKLLREQVMNPSVYVAVTIKNATYGAVQEEDWLEDED